jgi:hypothetical protein
MERLGIQGAESGVGLAGGFRTVPLLRWIYGRD